MGGPVEIECEKKAPVYEGPTSGVEDKFWVSTRQLFPYTSMQGVARYSTRTRMRQNLLFRITTFEGTREVREYRVDWQPVTQPVRVSCPSILFTPVTRHGARALETVDRDAGARIYVPLSDT
jgi:hypothetical protein